MKVFLLISQLLVNADFVYYLKDTDKGCKIVLRHYQDDKREYFVEGTCKDVLRSAVVLGVKDE